MQLSASCVKQNSRCVAKKRT